jgi:UDP-N-acetylglucosamine 2-epimerase (non-hydrolysing)
MAPIMKEMQKRGIGYNYVSTGQHQETMDEILGNFAIKGPDVRLYEGRDITGIPQMVLWSIRILLKVLFNRKAVFQGDKHGVVLVHGDTFSTLLGALMGKLAGLKVGHVESGLRSFNILQPFPEEIIRLCTFVLADLYFCPGPWAIDNLKKFRGKKVDTKVNTLFDSILAALPAVKAMPDTHVPNYPYGIVTLHRFENFKDAEAVVKVVERVEQIARQHRLLFILHKPTLINLKKHGLYDRIAENPNIELRPRYDYFHFVKLLLSAEFVVSDGGSNQEECYYLGIPVILLRNVTERQEGIGRNVVVSKFDPEIVGAFMREFGKYRFPFLDQGSSPSGVIVESCLGFE